MYLICATAPGSAYGSHAQFAKWSKDQTLPSVKGCSDIHVPGLIEWKLPFFHRCGHKPEEDKNNSTVVNSPRCIVVQVLIGISEFRLQNRPTCR